MTSAPNAATPAGLLASLKAQLPAALPTTMTASGPKPTAGNDLYEAYLFGLVVEAARAVGYKVSFHTALGPAASLHLRRSPGRLGSAGTPGSPFVHALLEFVGRPALELHTGVVIAGRSKVVHEADVLLLPQADADRARAANVDPASAKTRLVVEAKYYTSPVSLSTSREFLGLSKDLSTGKVVFACTLSNASATALLAGTSSVEYDVGVLPFRDGEMSFRSFVQRLLRDYRDRR